MQGEIGETFIEFSEIHSEYKTETTDSRLNNTVYLSFKDSKVCLAVSINRNLFEPRIFRSNDDFGLVRDYFDNLHLAGRIIEELNLNTRIWKQYAGL
ncbi:MAG: DUF3137 domain-containing protein [Victivallales bacterium]